MFNVTIIKLKDIIKLIFIAVIIYILGDFVFQNISINIFDKQVSFNTSDFMHLAINIESTIIDYISNKEIEKSTEKTEEVEEDFETIALKSIFQIATTTFKAQELETELGQDKQETQIADNNQEKQITETKSENTVSTNVATEVVTQNPIAENYNREYRGIKIKNETSYELTDDILNPDNLEINTDNILIFHTHTCESYTPSENYTYVASRKL